jgi:VWFA-related protein
MRPFLALVLLALAPMPAFAQGLPQMGETIDVNIVNFDVIVTDRAGNHVRGLIAADFEVRDRGKLVPITNFSEFDDRQMVVTVSTEPDAAPQPSVDAPTRDRRTIVVFIEPTAMTPAQHERFFGSLKSLLRDTVKPGDAAAIVSWNYLTKIQQDFTDDVDKLEAALDRIAATSTRVGVDVESDRIHRQFLQDMLDETDELTGTVSGGPSAMFSGYEQARHALVDIRRKTFALNTIIDTMASATGRRVLLMVTKRYSQYAGAEYFGGQVPPEHANELNTVELRESLEQHANAAGVTIYPLYPTGFVSSESARVEEGPRRRIFAIDAQRDAIRVGRDNLILLNETASLEQLAKKTGGVSGWGPSDVTKIADAVRNDLDSYYSIGFRAGDARAGARHTITIVAKRRGLNVRARREYVEKTESMRMADTVLASLYKQPGKVKLPFDIEVGAATRKGRRRSIPITLTIPMNALTALPAASGRTGAFRVYGAAGGVLGSMSDVFEKTQTFSIRDGDDVSAKHITYKFELLVDGRVDRLSLAVVDELSKESGVVRIPVGKSALRR